MSRTGMNDFLDRVRHDRDLAARLSAAVGEKEGDAAFAALADFAVQNGFDVAVGDAGDLASRFTDGAEREGELADSELDAMAGGSWFQLSDFMPGAKPDADRKQAILA